MKFVACISRADCGDLSADGLMLGRLYELSAPADSYGMARVIDGSGEEYMYPAKLAGAAKVQAQTDSTW